MNTPSVVRSTAVIAISDPERFEILSDAFNGVIGEFRAALRRLDPGSAPAKDYAREIASLAAVADAIHPDQPASLTIAELFLAHLVDEQA